MDYWIHGKCWDRGHLSYLLPASILLCLASIVLDESLEEEDRLTWKDSPDDQCSMPSAYMTTDEDAATSPWKFWDHIWKLKVLQHVRVLIWLMAHDHILTNYARWRQNMVDAPACGLCYEAYEDSLHALRDYREAKEVIRCLIFFMHKFFSPNLSNWIA